MKKSDDSLSGTRSGSGPRPDIDAVAAEWVIRMGDGLLSDVERERFDCWLAENPAHGHAFAEARSTWAELATLKHTSPTLAPRPAEPVPGPLARLGRGRVARSMVIAACVLTLCAGLGAFWFGNPLIMLEASYRTAPGQTRMVALSDGSRVQLGSSRALAVRFDNHERRVDLLSGEAYFTVAPVQGGETRLFVVESANGRVQALGTEFMVDRDGDGAEVTVSVHHVQVSVSSHGGQSDSVVLSPGQSVHYGRVSGLGVVTRADIAKATAWRRGRLIFSDARLADVIAGLNRYRRGRIVIADAVLGNRRVSGVFETSDTGQAVTLITQELGLRALALPPFVTVLYQR